MNKEFKKRIISSVVLLPISLFVIIKGSFLFNLFLVLCFSLTIYEWYMMSKTKHYHLLGYMFLIFSFYSAFYLRNFLDEKSLMIFVITLIICISTDIGGYIFGKILKGPKLTKLSPKKTFSGMFGGFICSFFITFILIENSDLIFGQYIKWKIDLFVYIFFSSALSQIGDITISFFKRLSKIKDTGKIIPGHGGILDRIDGIIFVFPFTYIIFKFNILTY
tara:strand:+ start:9057 stop:9716 length:660 start_codon:yes stop_codon:yes gene_type:complete